MRLVAATLALMIVLQSETRAETVEVLDPFDPNYPILLAEKVMAHGKKVEDVGSFGTYPNTAKKYWIYAYRDQLYLCHWQRVVFAADGPRVYCYRNSAPKL